MEYRDNSILIEAKEVFNKLDNENLIIIDCDVSELYQRAHIKGATTLPVHHYIKQSGYEKNAVEYPHVMNEIEFEELVNSLNINSKSEIIAYDNSGNLYSSRFWWCLNYFGLKNVKILNGGWKEWLDNDYPIDSGFNYAFKKSATPNVNKSDLVIKNDNSYICKLEDLQDLINDPNSIILDTRNIDEYTGANSRGNKRVGHVPGSVNIEWLEFIDENKNNKFKSQKEIESILNKKNITYEKQITTY
ncbi:MAG: sulfurtransferase [Dehalococcoidia bacterium]